MAGVTMRFAAASNKIRGLLFALILPAASLTATSARAAVQITIDKNAQILTVAVDGEQMYRWRVSSGLPSYETPNGSFKAFRMEEDHYSKEFDDAPMPHSIFFTKSGHAIHGTDSVSRLGSPASHGCVRLSRANAATLYALVQKEGVLNTTVTLSGSSQVALARSPQRRNDGVIARNDSGDPVQLAPQANAGARVSESDGTVGYDNRAPQTQNTRRVYRAPNGESYYAQQPGYQPQQTYPGYDDGQNYYGQNGYQQPTQPRRYYYRY